MSISSNIKWDRTEFFMEAKLQAPVLGRTVEVTLDPEDSSSKLPSVSQLRALDAFLALAPEEKARWTHQVALNCHYLCLNYEVDGEEPPLQLTKRADVWKHVRLGQILIPQHGTSADRYVFVHGGCDWEEEHGLELLFKNEQLIKVGQQNGLFANEEWSLYFINE